jgi:hypothetical protein
MFSNSFWEGFLMGAFLVLAVCFVYIRMARARALALKK